LSKSLYYYNSSYRTQAHILFIILCMTVCILFVRSVESSVKISRTGVFSVTAVSETRQESHRTEDLKRPPDDGQNKTQLSPNGGGGDLLSATSNVPIEKSNGSAILETRRVVDLDDRLIRPGIIGTMDIGKKALSQTSVNGFIKPPNVQLYSTTLGTLQLKNEYVTPLVFIINIPNRGFV